MFRKFLTVSVALVVAGFASMTVQAQSSQDEIASELDAVLTNMVALAEVFPADKYEWAPTEVVFPVRRHLVHVSQASYFFVGLGGVEAPEGVDVQGALENVTEKEDVVAFLKQTHEFAVSSIRGMSDETMDSMVDFYDGSQRSVRAGLLVYLRHNSEHLGQLISYARMQDIVPPWSE